MAELYAAVTAAEESLTFAKQLVANQVKKSKSKTDDTVE